MKHRNFAIAAGVAALAGLGAVAVSHASSTRASQPLTNTVQTIPAERTYPDSTAPALAEASSPATAAALGSSVMIPVSYPATERVVYRDRVVYRRAVAHRAYIHRRSKKHSAEIIGGSALGGAGLGALVGGKSGALIGGLVGGAAGTVYDRSTHKRVVRH